LLALAPAALHADQVLLRGGGSIDGVIVSKDENEVKVDIGAGRMTVPMTSVLEIKQAPSDLSEYRSRAAALQGGDVDGWRALGRWARERGLGAQAKEAYGRVVVMAPNDPEANEGLGRVLWNGRWVTQAEAYQAQGYVQFEGSWVTPEERQATLDQRAADAAADEQALAAHIEETNASLDAKRKADEEYWEEARNSGIPSSGGMAYWDMGMGPQLVPDQPGGSWP